eukprot:jgi/Mesen1/454/ME000101S10681
MQRQCRLLYRWRKWNGSGVFGPLGRSSSLNDASTSSSLTYPITSRLHGSGYCCCCHVLKDALKLPTTSNCYGAKERYTVVGTRTEGQFVSAGRPSHMSMSLRALSGQSEGRDKWREWISSRFQGGGAAKPVAADVVDATEPGGAAGEPAGDVAASGAEPPVAPARAAGGAATAATSGSFASGGVPHEGATWPLRASSAADCSGGSSEEEELERLLSSSSRSIGIGIGSGAGAVGGIAQGGGATWRRAGSAVRLGGGGGGLFGSAEGADESNIDGGAEDDGRFESGRFADEDYGEEGEEGEEGEGEFEFEEEEEEEAAALYAHQRGYEGSHLAAAAEVLTDEDLRRSGTVSQVALRAVKVQDLEDEGEPYKFRRDRQYFPGQYYELQNVRFLAQFISDSGKIMPRRQTKLAAKAQRKVARQIRASRTLGLLPFTTIGQPPFRFGQLQSLHSASPKWRAF